VQAAGNSTAMSISPKTLNLYMSKPYDGSSTFTNAASYSMSGMVNGDQTPTLISGMATTSSANIASYSSLVFNNLVLSNSNYTLVGGQYSLTIVANTIINTPRDLSADSTKPTLFNNVTNNTISTSSASLSTVNQETVVSSLKLQANAQSANDVGASPSPMSEAGSLNSYITIVTDKNNNPLNFELDAPQLKIDLTLFECRGSGAQCFVP
jgi:hypothetical protein